MSPISDRLDELTDQCGGQAQGCRCSTGREGVSADEQRAKGQGAEPVEGLVRRTWTRAADATRTRCWPRRSARRPRTAIATQALAQPRRSARCPKGMVDGLVSRHAGPSTVISNLTIRLAAAPDAAAIAALSRDEIEHGLPWTWREPRVRRAIADP